MDSSGFVRSSVEADAFLGGKIREYKLWYDGQVVRCLGVVFDGTGWGYGWIVNTGIHRAGSCVAWGRLQSGDYQEPGCSRNARDQPGPLSRGHGGQRRLAPAGAAPTGPRVSGCRHSR